MRCPSARGRWVVRSRSSNERDWDSHSRARFGRALLLPKVALACAIGHGSRSVVCSSAVDVLRVSNGLPARSGATRSAYAAQNPARRFSTKQACRKTAPLPEHRFATRYRSGDMRSVFRLRRSSPPNLGHCPCGARRALPALVVLRGAAMPRQVDSEVPRLDFHRCLGLARPLRGSGTPGSPPCGLA